MKLNQENLSKLSGRLSAPTYDRASLKTGIVHVGVGGFHRSHQAYYVHRLLEKLNEQDWAICGVGLRDADRKISEVLNRQDCLYTLVTQHPDGTEKSTIIGSIHEFLLAGDSSESVIDKMAHPDVRIVSLTITEGGYNFNPNTGEFDFDNPDVKHELAHPTEPQTIYGYLTAALEKRKSNGVKPFTILSCDNIQHNGDVTRKMVLAFAFKRDPVLAEWIAREVSFPNSMVDRITPATTPETTAYLKKTYDLEDEWCVVCEPFIQWVVEDKFCNGRPILEGVGVQFVPDVTPYEKMKIRLLNAGHSVLGIPGSIHGHPTIDACMSDEVFARFMRKFMDAEVTPILDPLEGIDIDKYKDQLEERFANPNIKDSVSRICSESSAKLPKFLIPTLIENLKMNGSIQYATFVLAAWCYYNDRQTNEKGEELEIIDVQKEKLHQIAKNTEKDWLAFIRQSELFGDLVNNETFTVEYIKAIQLIYKEKNIRHLMNTLVTG